MWSDVTETNLKGKEESWLESCSETRVWREQKELEKALAIVHKVHRLSKTHSLTPSCDWADTKRAVTFRGVTYMREKGPIFIPNVR